MYLVGHLLAYNLVLDDAAFFHSAKNYLLFPSFLFAFLLYKIFDSNYESGHFARSQLLQTSVLF